MDDQGKYWGTPFNVLTKNMISHGRVERTLFLSQQMLKKIYQGEDLMFYQFFDDYGNAVFIRVSDIIEMYELTNFDERPSN